MSWVLGVGCWVLGTKVRVELLPIRVIPLMND